MGIIIYFKVETMTRGTPAQGKRGNKSHTLSRYSGKQNWHKQKKRCASTGHPSGKVRRYNWSLKSKRRTGQGTGRMRVLKHTARKLKNGYREGCKAPESKKWKNRAGN